MTQHKIRHVRPVFKKIYLWSGGTLTYIGMDFSKAVTLWYESPQPEYSCEIKQNYEIWLRLYKLHENVTEEEVKQYEKHYQQKITFLNTRHDDFRNNKNWQEGMESRMQIKNKSNEKETQQNDLDTILEKLYQL